MPKANHLKVYSVYNADEEILFIGTRSEIKHYFEVNIDTVQRWISGKTKKYKCYHIGYSDDNLEDEP